MKRSSSFPPVTLLRDSRGAAIVEFALLAPVLLMILLGISGYGQYFLLAHSTQQLANDSARATIAGMSAAERLSLANAAMTRELLRLPEIRPGTATLSVEEAPPMITVRVRVDASRIGMFHIGLLPMPDPLIERSAVIQQGGVL
ncbi:pilus assembly protein [Sphingomonas sp. CL5.1]|uniref:TadE/TadG family type IV pilus assembly protein n=1 Tax=Sphingomonas sp. CL5.1 TaxID=2653203 RepID=UPI0015822291|nr:TadE/TadG family type IV pilus assembly protein [Sphingomonas sp. CL5.1]QKS01813.1 pilus assembly protein [Sphingomonas sp. CL5.1]